MSDTRNPFGRVLFATVLLIGLLSSFLSAQGSVNVTRLGQAEPRIQLDRWVDAANGIDDPLTEIVEITKGEMAGTGTFIPECRVMTALHVVLSMKHGTKTMTLQEGESLIGEKFDFETRPVPATGKKALGSFIVIGHGDPRDRGRPLTALEDWAIGYDEACLSKTLHLGDVKVLYGMQYRLLKLGEYLTAGHSKLEAALNKNGDYALYVDSKCGTVEIEENYTQDNYFMTNCSVSHGGSGQLLLKPVKRKGVLVKRENGQPQLVAAGMFQALAGDHPEIAVPNSTAIGVAAFTYDFYARILRFLHGPVDLETLLKSKTAGAGLARGPAPYTALGSWTGSTSKVSPNFSMMASEWRILWSAVSGHSFGVLKIDVNSIGTDRTITTIRADDIKGQLQGESVVRAPAGKFYLYISGENLLQWRVSVEGR